MNADKNTLHGTKVVAREDGHILRGWFVAPCRNLPDVVGLFEVYNGDIENDALSKMYGDEIPDYILVDYSDMGIEDWEHPEWGRVPEEERVTAETPNGVLVKNKRGRDKMFLIGRKSPDLPGDAVVWNESRRCCETYLWEELRLVEPLPQEVEAYGGG